ncbi:MAG TPA: thioredoxin domain-containing protein, partial [Solibacterales bacterium]|nr:thioredoxin domain-containing protein [Bryobacterales bacterium]
PDEEGAFFIWKQSEIEELVGQPAADWFCYRWGVEEDGNVRQDPHGEFTGKNILYESRSIEDVARRFDAEPDAVRAAIQQAAAALLAAREQRPRPHLDDKILTAWNGLMISAFAKGAQVLGDERYRAAAVRAAEFVLSKMYRDGVLLRRFRDGEAAIPGFLDDYAFFALALLDLYEAAFDLRYLETAVELARSMRALFEDEENGGYYSTVPGEGHLVLRLKDDYDGAEPSGNSAAALLLLRLAQITGDGAFQNAANRTLEAFAPRLNSAPIAVPQMMVALDFATSKPRQVILVGERGSDGLDAMLRAVRSRFAPNTITLLVDGPEAREKLAAWNPPIEGMTMVEGKATAYVCEDFACQLPSTRAEDLLSISNR